MKVDQLVGAELERAWFAICDALSEIDPDWMMYGPVGVEAAVAKIRALAAQGQGEAVAWRIDTDDDVERVAKAAGWNNRSYMTPADYAIWCSRMREFVRLAAGHAAPPATPAGVPDVVSEVMAELEEAIRKFPTWPTDPLHAVGVFNEEAGELSKAVLQQVYEPHKNAADDVRKEARQAAAMALRFLVSIDSYDWTPGTQHEQPSLAAPSATKGDGGAE